MLEIGFKFDSELFRLRDTDVLSLVAALQASFDVHVVVLDNSKNNIRCRNAFSSLRSPEHALLLHVVIDVGLTHAAVREIVMGDVMDIFAF